MERIKRDRTQMSRSLSIALAQLNLLVGDIEGNTERMLQIVQEQQKAGADLVMFSELALSGYPPEDLLYRNDFYQRCDAQLLRLVAGLRRDGDPGRPPVARRRQAV